MCGGVPVVDSFGLRLMLLLAVRRIAAAAWFRLLNVPDSAFFLTFRASNRERPRMLNISSHPEFQRDDAGELPVLPQMFRIVNRLVLDPDAHRFRIFCQAFAVENSGDLLDQLL